MFFSVPNIVVDADQEDSNFGAGFVQISDESTLIMDQV